MESKRSGWQTTLDSERGKPAWNCEEWNASVRVDGRGWLFAIVEREHNKRHYNQNHNTIDCRVVVLWNLRKDVDGRLHCDDVTAKWQSQKRKITYLKRFLKQTLMSAVHKQDKVHSFLRQWREVPFRYQLLSETKSENGHLKTCKHCKHIWGQITAKCACVCKTKRWEEETMIRVRQFIFCSPKLCDGRVWFRLVPTCHVVSCGPSQSLHQVLFRPDWNKT